MKDKNFDPNSLYEKLMSATNAAANPLFLETPSETHQVKLRPDKTVGRARFKPDPLIPGGYLAHPITIRAVRLDIFVGGEGFEDLECLYKCHSCSEQIDVQFWKFCPYCEAPFKK